MSLFIYCRQIISKRLLYFGCLSTGYPTLLSVDKTGSQRHYIKLNIVYKDLRYLIIVLRISFPISSAVGIYTFIISLWSDFKKGMS